MLLRRLRVAIKIADAIKAAHECSYIGHLGFQERGILHGDIKPHNVLVRDADDNPMILDFMIPDLQRLIGVQGSGWDKDERGDYFFDLPLTGVFGTPGYMSPEQEVDGIVTPASDIYSLGETFRRLFWPADRKARLGSTGRPSSRSVDDDEPEEDYDHDRYIVARHSGADRTESALAKLTAQMSATQPKDRPQGMSEVLERLRAIEAGKGVSAKRYTSTSARVSFAERVAALISRFGWKKAR